MPPMAERDIGPMYEMRIYTSPSEEAIQLVLDTWGETIVKLEEVSPLAGCWHSETDGLHKFYTCLRLHVSFGTNESQGRDSREGNMATEIWREPNKDGEQNTDSCISFPNAIIQSKGYLGGI